MLAGRLYEQYRYDDCAVVALNDGGVLVGEQIAAVLHCTLSLILVEDIEVPGESTSFGGVSQTGAFTYNSAFSSGEIDEYTAEFHGYLDDQKREKFQRLNRLLADGGVIDKDMLRDRVIILTSDGIDLGTELDVALEFLKPIRTKKIVIAMPFATIPAIDKLHIGADELHILDVKENFLGVNHYYDDNNLPSHEQIVEKINHMIMNWQ